MKYLVWYFATHLISGWRYYKNNSWSTNSTAKVIVKNNIYNSKLTKESKIENFNIKNISNIVIIIIIIITQIIT